MAISAIAIPKSAISRSIPRWLFVTIVIIVFGAGILLSLFWPFMQRFQNPDRSLAWFALLFAIALLVQQSTTYIHGVVYMVSDKSNRKTIDENLCSSPTVMAKGKLGVTMRITYWACIILLILISASLLIGTIREPSNTDIQKIVESNNQTQQSIQQLNNRIDQLLQQNNALMERLEAQNGNSNSTGNGK
jgi:predicted PurR-regulated permease PerM